MKKLLLIFLTIFTAHHLSAQSLVLDSTRFVGGDSSCGNTQGNFSIITKDGGILFVGYTTCYSGGADIPPNFPDASGADGGNVVIGKLDSNMALSWVKVYGGSQFDDALGAVQTPDGGYAVLAYTESGDGNVTGNHGTGDLWLVRVDSLGNLLWQKCYGSPADEQPVSIALTPDSGFILLGISNGSGDDVPTHYSGSEFDYDWFVIKVDSAGNKQWAKSIGGTGDENPNRSIIAANNAYYLVSSSTSTDYDCTDTAWCAGNAQNMNMNYYIFKLDTAAGNILWDSSYGGSNADIAYNAVWDSRDSSIVVNGITLSDDYMVTGYHGDSDFWVIKTDKNGTLKWEKCLGTPLGESGSGITITNDGYMAYGVTNAGGIGLSNNLLYALNDTGAITDSIHFGGTVGYETPTTITAFKSGFAACGSSGSPGFTAGINLSPPSTTEDAFVSYLSYSTLGISNLTGIRQQIKIFPNPSNGIIQVTIPLSAGSLTVINSIGESIYTAIVRQNEAQVAINTAGWASGLYIAKWQGQDGTVLTTKFIKV